MKTILNLLLLFMPFCLICQTLPSNPLQSRAPSALTKPLQTPNDRKLVFSPYVSTSQDLSANSLGQENHANLSMNSSTAGPFKDAPVPSFGMGGMMPPSLGLTNQPYNYMNGSAMMHPMSPLNNMAPMTGAGVNMQMGLNDPHMARGLNNNAFGSMNQGMGFKDDMAMFDDDTVDFNELDNIGAAPSFNQDQQLNSYAAFKDNNQDLVIQCKDTQDQAIKLSNAIMRRQNKAIYKEIMNYLLKSKYLLSMTEIKLTRVLRKKVYALMNQYSSITEDNIEFIPMKRDYNLKPKSPIGDFGLSYNNGVDKEFDVGADFSENAPGFDGLMRK